MKSAIKFYLFLSLACLASTSAVAAVNWSYLPPVSEAGVSPSEWHLWRMRLENSGLISLSADWNVKTFGFHQIAMSRNGARVAMLRWGLRGKGDVPMRTQISGGTLIHVQQRDGSLLAVFLVGFTQKEISDLVTERSAAWFNFSLLPQAHAAGTCTFANDRALPAVTEHVQEGSLLKTIGACATSALQGSKDEAQGTVDFFRELYNNPGKVFSEGWRQTKELVAFVRNIKGEFKAFIKSIEGLSWAVAQEVLCQMVGQSVANLAKGFGVGGLAKATLSFQKAIAVLAKSNLVLNLLSKLNQARKLVGDQLKRAISYLLRNDRKRIEMAKTFSERGFEDLAKRALICEARR